MEKLKKNQNVLNYILLAFLLTISCFSRIAIFYARYLAYGTEFKFTYFLAKGIIIGIIGIVIYYFAGRYGYNAIKKQSFGIAWIGTVILLVLSIFQNIFPATNILMLSRIMGYVYAALPILRVVILCALAESMGNICEHKFSVKGVIWIAVSILFAALSDNIVRLIMLFVYAVLFIKKIKQGNFASKAFKIIFSIFLIGILALEIYSLGYAILNFIKMMNEPGYMSGIARNIIFSAKPFGQIDNLSVIGGNVNDFSLLWLMGYIGYVPTLLAMIAVICSICFMLKSNNGNNELQSLRTVAVCYIIIRLIFAIILNFGIILPGFFSSIPFLPDSVAGIMSVLLLLGVATRNKICKLR